MTLKKRVEPARNSRAQYALHLIPGTESCANSYIIKNVISFVMAVTLIFSMFVFSAPSCYASASSHDVKGEHSFKFLKSVGIMPESESYLADSVVTRGQFVNMVIGLSGIKPGDVAPSHTGFTDVPATHPYASSIAYAKNLGVISGSSDSVFNPDSPVKYDQAVKIICDLLDYTHIATAHGGYPFGYIKVSNDIKLGNGVNVAQNGELTMENVSVLIANAANAEMMMMVSAGDTVEYQTVEDCTALSERLGVYCVEGIIEANCCTDLYAKDSSVDFGSILIEGIRMDVSSTDADEYVGYRAEIYYTKEKSGLKAVYMALSDQNMVVSCNVKSLNTDKGALTYDVDENTSKKLNVKPDASYILNGKFASMRYTELPCIEKGNVVFISNDGDSTIDVVHVTSFETLIVSGVGAASNRIAVEDGMFVELDSESDEYVFEIYKDENLSSLKNIVPGSVMLLAQSKGEGVNKKMVYISDKTVSGILEEKGDETIVVGGEEYEINQTLSDKLILGRQYEFLVDYFGEIAGVRNLQSAVYGYLYGITSNHFGEVRCKILSENNRWVELDFKKTLKFNGETLHRSEVYEKIVQSEGGYRDVIRYNVSADNEVCNLETALDLTQYSLLSDEASLAAENNVFRKSYSGSQVWRSRSNSFEGKICAENDCVVFYVPENATADDLSVMKVGTLPSDESYDIVAYDVDKGLNTPVVQIKKIPLGGGTSSNFFFVKGTGQAIDSDGDVVPALRGYWRGFEIAIQVKLSATLTQADVDALEVGTPILFSIDDSGKITKFVNCSPDENGYYNGPSNRGAYYTSSCQAGGVVLKNDYINSHLVVNTSLLGDYFNTGYSDDTIVYIYNKSTGDYREGSVADIVPGDVIISKLMYFFSNEIAVIRE